MSRFRRRIALTGALLISISVLLEVGPPPLLAQEGHLPIQSTRPGGEPELRFEREYFIYPTGDRRDPFASLAAMRSVGPHFEELSLMGVIHSTEGQSVALLSDGSGRIHRVRRGDIVGNARVLTIAPLKVTFAVENFGVVQRGELELRRESDVEDHS